MDGTPAADNDLWMMSLIICCRVVLPSADRQDSPCVPSQTTCLPHTHVGSTHKDKPSRSPTTINNLVVEAKTAGYDWEVPQPVTVAGLTNC